MYKCFACFQYTDNYKAQSFRIKTNTVICKECHCREESNRQIRKKAEANPDDHMVCNDCDRIYNKFHCIHNKKDKSKVKMYENCCKFCMSKDVEQY